MQPNKTFTKTFSLTKSLSLIYGVLFSIFIWLVYYPGVFSADSMYFIYESKSALYSDWHSPFVALVLSLVPRVVTKIGFVIFVQVLLGLLGVRKLVIQLARLFGATQASSDQIALVILIILSLPLTPFSIYLNTLWTDTWLSIFLVWTIGLLIELHLDSSTQSFLDRSVKTTFVLFFMILSILVRTNAPVIYPALVLCLNWALAGKKIKWQIRLMFVSLPVLIYFSFLFFQYRVLDIKRGHAEHAIYALDIASMIVLDPDICRDLSIGSCDLVIGVYSQEFVVGHGAIDFTFNQGRPSYIPFYDLIYYPKLSKEFFSIVRDRPTLFLKVKLLNYFDYISPNETRYFYQKENRPDNNGVAYAHPFSQFTNVWFSMTDFVLQNPLLHWFSFVHAVWIVVNVVGLAICARLFRRDVRAALIGLLLLVPASYYASYLIAFTSSEFRFMYPSMLIVQVITLTFLFSQITKWIERKRAMSNPANSET